MLNKINIGFRRSNCLWHRKFVLTQAYMEQKLSWGIFQILGNIQIQKRTIKSLYLEQLILMFFFCDITEHIKILFLALTRKRLIQFGLLAYCREMQSVCSQLDKLQLPLKLWQLCKPSTFFISFLMNIMKIYLFLIDLCKIVTIGSARD